MFFWEQDETEMLLHRETNLGVDQPIDRSQMWRWTSSSWGIASLDWKKEKTVEIKEEFRLSVILQNETA